MSYEIVARAPARVCLFGDHQDYLGLPIIACAIDRFIEVRAVPNDTDLFRIQLPDLGGEETILLDDYAGDDFLSLGLRVVSRQGITFSQGFDITISGNIPINSGLSSSSALMVAWIDFLVQAAGKPTSRESIAKLAYEAEVLERGASGGKMDQYTIGIGGTIYLDTVTDEVEKFSYRIPGLIVGNSGESKDTEGFLSRLKNGATEAIRHVKAAFPDFTMETEDPAQYRNALSDDQWPIFEAAVENYAITRAARAEFRKGAPDLHTLADLMNRHHHFLKNNLKITTKRIDAMIDASLKAGAIGAKIVGSGGGGCVVAIAQQGREAEVMDAMLRAGGVEAFGVENYS